MDLGQQILRVFILLTPVTYVLAAMRITRLVNGDTILDKLRSIPLNRSHRARQSMLKAKRSGQSEAEAVFAAKSRRWATVLYFIECPWCVGMWVCLLTAWVPLFYASNLVVQYIMVALAGSHLIGVFAFAADTEEVEVEEDPD